MSGENASVFFSPIPDRIFPELDSLDAKITARIAEGDVAKLHIILQHSLKITRFLLFNQISTVHWHRCSVQITYGDNLTTGFLCQHYLQCFLNHNNYGLFYCRVWLFHILKYLFHFTEFCKGSNQAIQPVLAGSYIGRYRFKLEGDHPAADNVQFPLIDIGLTDCFRFVTESHRYDPPGVADNSVLHNQRQAAGETGRVKSCRAAMAVSNFSNPVDNVFGSAVNNLSCSEFFCPGQGIIINITTDYLNTNDLTGL